MVEVPLEASVAKLRPLRDQPYAVSHSGLPIVADKQTEGRESTVGESTISPGSTPRRRRSPSMRTCHICGTPQLLRSYKLHFSRCAQAWEIDESKKPASQRRPLPAGPRLADGTQPSETTPLADLDEFNRQALLIWKSQALETCPNCHRSFHAKALKAHIKGCHAPTEAFLGTSYVGASSTSRRTGESSRTYRTVQKSLERSSRVTVSKASPVQQLDASRDESKRVVSRVLRETASWTSPGQTPRGEQTTSEVETGSTARSPASTNTTSRKQAQPSDVSSTPRKSRSPTFAIDSKSQPSLRSGSTSNAQASFAQGCRRSALRTSKRRNTSSRVRRSSARTRSSGDQQATLHEPDPIDDAPPRRTILERDKSIELRLEALEAGHVAISETLARVELLLRNAQLTSRPIAAEVRSRDNTKAAGARGKPWLVQEHERFFRGHIDLAWPEDINDHSSHGVVAAPAA